MTAKAVENKAAKRSKILESAYNLFLNNTFAATAIDDVVRAAGVAKGTFYLYFRDKYDLLNQILAQRSSEIVGQAFDYALSEGDKGLLETGRRIVNYIIDYLSANKDFTALLNKNLSRCFRQIASGDIEAGNSVKERLLEYFGRENLPQDRAVMTLYILTDLIGSAACDAILGLGPYTIDEIRPYLLDTAEKILGGEAK